MFSSFTRQEKLKYFVQLVEMLIVSVWKMGLHLKGSKPKYHGNLLFSPLLLKPGLVEVRKTT